MEQPEILRNQVAGTKLVANLKKRGFGAYYCATAAEALEQALALIPQDHVVAWGGSMTIAQMGLLAAVKEKYQVIDRDKATTAEERVAMMRQSLLADTFLMSANAISEAGELVNIDGNGNRVAALVYGPSQVLVIAGMNKVAKTLEAAHARARGTAAPINAQRFPGLKTPCYVTGYCGDCTSPDCICAQILTTRFCRTPERIKVILVGESLGF